MGQGPVDARRLTGVSGVDPIDVPLVFESDDEANIKGAAGSDRRGQRDHLNREMLGLYRTGTSIANDLELPEGRWRCEKADEYQEPVEMASDVHQTPL
jgi:hypothetical protein